MGKVMQILLNLRHVIEEKNAEAVRADCSVLVEQRICASQMAACEIAEWEAGIRKQQTFQDRNYS